jgi:hypothetical protein
LSPKVPLSFPSGGEWSLRILAHEGRFAFGVHRREMNAIKYLGQLENIFGVSVTTRNWNTMLKVAETPEACWLTGVLQSAAAGVMMSRRG